MNYPNALKKGFQKQIIYANRGMSLEEDINESNKYYLINNIGVIYKKPTPITISKVDYKKNMINEAYFRIPSTTDYNGIYKGKYIDFEAKETKNQTSFPLNNIHEHQLEHLDKIYNHGGIGFIIIRFTTLNKTFFIDAKVFNDYVKSNSRKSVPIDYIEKNGYIIKDKLNPRVDYLEIVNNVYLKGESV